MCDQGNESLIVFAGRRDADPEGYRDGLVRVLQDELAAKGLTAWALVIQGDLLSQRLQVRSMVMMQ